MHRVIGLTLVASLASVATLASVASAQDYVDECPQLNGFFADAVQCDRYYECKNGEVETFYRHCKEN